MHAAHHFVLTRRLCSFAIRSFTNCSPPTPVPSLPPTAAYTLGSNSRSLHQRTPAPLRLASSVREREGSLVVPLHTRLVRAHQNTLRHLSLLTVIRVLSPLPPLPYLFCPLSSTTLTPSPPTFPSTPTRDYSTPLVIVVNLSPSRSLTFPRSSTFPRPIPSRLNRHSTIYDSRWRPSPRISKKRSRRRGERQMP